MGVQGLTAKGRSSLWNRGGTMRKRKGTEKTQWQDILRGIQYLATAFYWIVKLFRELAG